MSIKAIKVVSAGLVTLGFAASVYATGPGFYIGGQVGKTNTHNLPQTLQTGVPGALDGSTPGLAPGQTGSTTINPSNTGVGGRLYGGYSLSQYFGVELGFTHYAPSTYTIPSGTNLTIGPVSGYPSSKPAINTNAFDFVGKGSLAIPRLGIGVFGKAGVAIVKVGYAGTFTNIYNPSLSGQTTILLPDGSSTVVPGGFINSTKTTTYFKPTAAVGLSYDLSQNWVVDFTLSRIFGGGGMQNADLYSLGISYHFVDKYCGQFLC